MLSASCDADAGASGVTYQKSHVAPHFNHVDLRNAMMPFMTASASLDVIANGIPWPERLCMTSIWSCWSKECCQHCDVNTGTSGVTLPKIHIAPNFDGLDLMNAMVPLMVQSASHDADTNAITSHDTNTNASGIMWYQWSCWLHHMTKRSSYTSFQFSFSYTKECNDATDDVDGIMWQW